MEHLVRILNLTEAFLLPSVAGTQLLPTRGACHLPSQLMTYVLPPAGTLNNPEPSQLLRVRSLSQIVDQALRSILADLTMIRKILRAQAGSWQVLRL